MPTLRGSSYYQCDCARRIREHRKQIRLAKARTQGMISELIAVETLEYHNQNWLANSPKKRSEDRMDLLTAMQKELNKLTA